MIPRVPAGCATFPVPVYSGCVVLCLTRDGYNKVHKLVDGDEYKHIDSCMGVSARLSDKTGRSVYLVGVFDGGHKTLVHELAHTTFSILSHSSVTISARHDEAFAYLIDSLYGACADAMKRIRRRKRK